MGADVVGVGEAEAVPDVVGRDVSPVAGADQECGIEQARDGGGGRVGGRPSVVNDKLLRAARDMLPNPENSIAALLGVSVGTLYNHIPDLKELRTFRVPAQLEGSTS
ncbi:hypothetical protein [Streptomyces sp. NPDC056296]|uniref:hypothetical protein n=1 Tax=Streptomyces sp. NPDC056296 TaxID=3345775 RepID=UPI0035D80DAE